MFTGSLPSGRSSPNTSMRSTRSRMRPVSSTMSWASGRSSSAAPASRSCAAPRMPDSGFLISWASTAAIADTERAAPRCESCRSIILAMLRCCSMSMTRSPSSDNSEANTSIAWFGRSGMESSSSYSFTVWRVWRTWSARPVSGCAKARTVCSARFLSTASLMPKNSSAARFAKTMRFSLIDHHEGVREALNECLEIERHGAQRGSLFAFFALVHQV